MKALFIHPIRMIGLSVAGVAAFLVAAPLALAQVPTASLNPAATPAPTATPAPAPAPAATPTPSPTPANPAAAASLPFLKAFPNLNEYVYHEPKSGFFLGVGITPFALVKDRTEFGANFFQVHYISPNWDVEVLNVSYAVQRGQSSTYQASDFVFRAAVKFRIGEIMSVGPLIGYEFISFPNVTDTLLKLPYTTPQEPFSSRGLIYGAMVSETVKYHENYRLQVNEVVYQQTYSNTTTPEGWNYNYLDSSLRANPTMIGSGLVTMVELSFLF